jgi:hypothetical protein
MAEVLSLEAAEDDGLTDGEDRGRERERLSGLTAQALGDLKLKVRRISQRINDFGRVARPGAGAATCRFEVAALARCWLEVMRPTFAFWRRARMRFVR